MYYLMWYIIDVSIKQLTWRLKMRDMDKAIGPRVRRGGAGYEEYCARRHAWIRDTARSTAKKFSNVKIGQIK